MSNISNKFIGAAAVTVALAGFAMSASAADQSQWDKNHPRRAEVNQRLSNQKRAIHNDVKNGTLTKQQAGALHRDDNQIRQEERDMASQDNGHITKSEQKVLNQQEDGVKSDIPPR
jgi:Spy/CpxP family protein refolding chaperone